MNETIKELALKSGIRFDDWGHAITSHGNAELEKFANAIIKECASMTEAPGYIGRRDLDWKLVFQEHFGIK